MKKKYLGLLSLLLAFSLAACNGPAKSSEPSKSSPASSEPTPSSGSQSTPSSSSSQTTPTTRYTVIFENNGTRVATESVKSGEKLSEAQLARVANPTAPEGKKFVGWADKDGTIVDLTTYVVTGNVTFYAVFEDAGQQVDPYADLSVDDKKEAGKTYYLVMGWWEVKDPNDPTKVTSHLSPADVKLFYNNLINYLKAAGASDTDIANIQFRDYSSATVADMGTAINADGDVDIMIGVGNNINSQAGCSLYNGDNAYKFQTPMGDDSTQRYVACLSSASDLGVSVYDWLKNTDAGKASLLRELTADEIAASIAANTVNLTVTVHGDTDVVTQLEDKKTAITLPAITAPTGKHFVGFALTENGQVVLEKSENITYEDLKALVASGATTLDLYPIFENDLDVTVTVHGKTDEVSKLALDDDAITLPEFEIPEDYHLVGFALSANGEVVIEKTTGLTLADVKDLLTEGANTLDLYPVYETNPVMEYDLSVYVQIQGTNLFDYEVDLLEARFNDSRTDDKKIKIEGIKVSDAQGFIDALADVKDADVIVGGNNPVDKEAFTRHADGPTANAGAKHFRSANRKIAILNDAEAHGHLDLAKEFYAFVKADAQEFEFHYTYWSNANKWTTEEERTTMTAAIEARVNTFLGIKEGENLADIYNVKLTNYVATGTKVADLGAETRALREGKGTDLIIGCGGNVDETEPGKTTAGMTIVEKKAIGAPFVAASSRYVALVTENPLAKDVYDNYFVTEAQPE